MKTLDPFNLDGPTANPFELARITGWANNVLGYVAVAVLCAVLAHCTIVPPAVRAFLSSVVYVFSLAALVAAFFAVSTFRQVDRATRERRR